MLLRSIFYLLYAQVQRKNPKYADMSYQVHGRAPRWMWLNKQLRWCLSKVLYLRFHGLQGKEGDCHNQYVSNREVNTLLTMQVYSKSAMKKGQKIRRVLFSQGAESSKC
jgi:hypothetical protein